MRLPEYVTYVLNRLEARGYEAYAVGGCVRDTIMKKTPNDYDVTTNALPEESKKCFEGMRVIETGIKHGTVTVISDGNNVEVTTYRLDGEYTDNRHPSEVTFTTDITEDLSRRDFTVNAMAYSPTRGFVDVFCGRGDIERGVIRCVGDAYERFHEDGLRILRALRFSSTLDFSIAEETAGAIHGCRELLRNISVERIYSEMSKLILGKGARRILSEYRDVIEVFIPDISGASEGEYLRAVGVTALSPSELSARYAALLGLLGGEGLIVRTLDSLNSDTATKRGASAVYTEASGDSSPDKVYARYLLSRAGYEVALLSVGLRKAIGETDGERDAVASAEALRGIIEREYASSERCVSLSELRIGGRDLMGIGFRGCAIGKTLSALLSLVIEDKLPNEAEALKNKAIELFAEG